MGQDYSKLSVVRHSDFLWAPQFNAQKDLTGNVHQSLSTGTPNLGQVTTTMLMGFLIDADNEAMETVMEIPSYWDRRHDVEVYPLWVCDAAVADVVFGIWYGVFKPGEAVVGLTALVSATDSSAGTALVIDRAGSGASFIPASVLNADADDKFLRLKIGVNDKSTLGSDLLWLLGVEFVYTPRWGFSKFGIKGRNRTS